ncbi:extensin-like [Sinocyclocheilus rhinocerous]|uniref:extensin-like n=1 Tax=Sinocyclocheilus rhinocerous TaxID=307959 RepID=UPI0007BA6FC7|nr:PREDICTED: extensin-like [Sinocyclocheilus rhinocerous]
MVVGATMLFMASQWRPNGSHCFSMIMMPYGGPEVQLVNPEHLSPFDHLKTTAGVSLQVCAAEQMRTTESPAPPGSSGFIQQPSPSMDPVDQLLHLRQGGLSIEEYVHRFFLPDPPWWYPAPSAPPWWFSALPAQPWWSLALPWLSVPLVLPWLTAPPWLPAPQASPWLSAPMAPPWLTAPPWPSASPVPPWLSAPPALSQSMKPL